MWTFRFAAAQLATVLALFSFGSTAIGQTVTQGWMGGSQAPHFPAPLPRQVSTFGDLGYQTGQALPGQTPAQPQQNPSTGQANQGLGQTPGTTTQTDPSAAPAPAATPDSFLKEVQAGIAAISPGRFENTKYKWYGFVRLDAIFDLDPIRTTDMFVTSAIPVPQGRGQNFVLTPRYTRLGFDTSTPWKDMDWTINTKIEMDFFNGNTSGAFGSFPLRLRFAFIDFGPFRFGQAASLFMDYDVFPDVLDYEGPPGMVLMRQPIAAIKWELTDRLVFNLGVEQPYSDIIWDDGAGFIVNPGTGIITTPGVARNVQEVPDVTGNVRFKHDYGHLQVAGIARKLTFQPAVGEEQDEFGYGVNVTGTFHPWAVFSDCMPEDAADRTPLQKSRLLGQYAIGRGINRYIQDINGLGLDGVFDPVNNFDLLESRGWFLCYEHFLTDRVIANICYGEADTDLAETLPDDTYKMARYAAFNLIWLPVERMGVGVEFLFGERENKNGESATARRVQAGIQYKF
jgi:hypothetical protein